HVEGGGGTQVPDVRRVVAGVGVELQRGTRVVDGERLGQAGGVGADQAEEAEAAAAAVVSDGAGREAGDLVAADDDVAVPARPAEVAGRELIAAGVGGHRQRTVDARQGAGVARGVGGDVDDVVAGAAEDGGVVVDRLDVGGVVEVAQVDAYGVGGAGGEGAGDGVGAATGPASAAGPGPQCDEGAGVVEGVGRAADRDPQDIGFPGVGGVAQQRAADLELSRCQPLLQGFQGEPFTTGTAAGSPAPSRFDKGLQLPF